MNHSRRDLWGVAQRWNKFRIAPLMKTNFSRRDFLATSTALAAGLGFGLGAVPSHARDADPTFKTKLHKALIVGKPTEEELKRFKDAGFDGVEAGIVPPQEAETCRKVAEKCGMRIHSVLRGGGDRATTGGETLPQGCGEVRHAHPLGVARVGRIQQRRPGQGREDARRHRGRLARGAGVRRGDSAAGALPDWRYEDALTPAVCDRVRPEERPPHARR